MKLGELRKEYLGLIEIISLYSKGPIKVPKKVAELTKELEMLSEMICNELQTSQVLGVFLSDDIVVSAEIEAKLKEIKTKII